MKKNKSAFSIVIAIGLVLVMSLLVLYILEYMIPYSKNVKWIENSSNAFYQAENSIEDALKKFKDRWDSNFNDYSKDFSMTESIDYKFDTTSSGTEIPYNWEGNSEFDTTFNKISQWDPIQLKIWNWIINLWDLYFSFKTPEIEWKIYTLSWWNLPIINWQLTTENFKTLNSSWSYILANDIDIINKNIFNWTIANNENIKFSNWQLLDQTWSWMVDFYTNNCDWTNSWCTLKMSIINKLESTTWVNIPYLEYKITHNSNFPLRFSRIKSDWKSYGFQKHLEVKIPQQTTNEAFDFTVFQ